MQFVDKQNYITGLNSLINALLQPLFKLASVFGTGKHAGQIQRDQPHTLHDIRDIAVGDFLSNALGNGCFTNSGLTNQHRVILGPAAEYLLNPVYFLFTADNRIKMSFSGQLGQVCAEIIKIRCLCFRFILLRGTG